MNATAEEGYASPIIQLFHGELCRRLEAFDSQTSDQTFVPAYDSLHRKMVRFPPGNHILFPDYQWEEPIQQETSPALVAV